MGEGGGDKKQNIMTILTLGYSTCPNDTLAFYALAHHRFDFGDIDFRIEMADVEKLNQKARKGILDVTKLSFAALGNLMDTYGLLRSGAALGRGCGPLIVARPGVDLNAMKDARVAIPGEWTTAAMLLGLFSPFRLEMVPMSFEQIMPALQSGEYDMGVIIHEGRFTYERYGLKCLLDLGEWWEQTSGLPIPLGCIAARRDLPRETIRQIELLIQKSVLYGLENRKEAAAYISTHAQEMASSVVDQHIDLYVNDFTVDMGEEGARAVESLFRMAREKGLLPKSASPLFTLT